MAIPAAAGQSIVGPPARLYTGPVTNGQGGPVQAGAEPDILDDIPEGSEQPPAAEPPPANRQNFNTDRSPPIHRRTNRLSIPRWFQSSARL